MQKQCPIKSREWKFTSAEEAVYKCDENNCAYATIFPTEIMLHIEWHYYTTRNVSSYEYHLEIDKFGTFTPISGLSNDNIRFKEFMRINKLLRSFQIQNPRLEFVDDVPLFLKPGKLTAVRQKYFNLFGYQNRYRTYTEVTGIYKRKFETVLKTQSNFIEANEFAKKIMSKRKQKIKRININQGGLSSILNTSIEEMHEVCKPQAAKTPLVTAHPVDPPADEHESTSELDSSFEGTLNCNLCPRWANEFFTENKLIQNACDLDAHKKMWHNQKYQAERCHHCGFRALNLSLFREYHDKFGLYFYIITQFYIFIIIFHFFLIIEITYEHISTFKKSIIRCQVGVML